MSNHIIWTIPGLTRFNHHGDLMHGGDLGPLLGLHASTFNELVSTDGYYHKHNMDASIRALWADVLIAYKEVGESKRMQTLTVEMFQKKGTAYPTLKCKAAESRHLIKAMIVVLRNCSTGSAHDDHRLFAYESIDAMYDLVHSSGLFLSPAEAALTLQHCEEFLLHLNWLATEAMNAGKLLWGITTKHHYLWHVAWFARYQSPRASWCYQFEDFIGKIQGSGMACTAGTAMHRVPEKVFQNYRLAMSQLLQHYM